MAAIKEKLKDTIRGMIYGQCLGDAVGLITEFKMKKDKPKIIFPYKDPIRNWPVNDWTDDSDHMILLMDTIIESNHDFIEKELDNKDILNFADKIKKWKMAGFKELGDTCGMGIGGTTATILNEESYTENPIQTAQNIWLESGRKIAPNGAIMRTSILSVIYIYKFIEDQSINPDFFRTIKMFCQSTHYDMRCVVSCWVLCFILQNIIVNKVNNKTTKLANLKQNCYKVINMLCQNIKGSDMPTANINSGRAPKIWVDDKYIQCKNEQNKYNFMQEIHDYFNTSLKKLELDDTGKIGYTYKCMSCALWVIDLISLHVKRNDNTILSFKKIIIAIVEECGDADTNAATAGSVLGAYIGYEKLQQQASDWLDALPNKQWLDIKIDKLFQKMNLID